MAEIRSTILVMTESELMRKQRRKICILNKSSGFNIHIIEVTDEHKTTREIKASYT